MAASSTRNTLINTHDFKFFNKTRIDEQLLLTQPFIDALFLVESTIGNPNLSVKFGQTCMAVLRNERLFNLRKCRRRITEIYMHLIKVCQNINFELDNLADEWSTFTLCHRSKSMFDIITIDRSTVIGAGTIPSNDHDAHARITYFFYTKILHELAHACMAELGRSLPVEDDDEQFSSPTTHGLTGEAGNSIERHFFGSIVDGIGHYTDNTRSVYEIDHIILRERQKKRFVKNDYFQKFCALNFAIITSIPDPDTETRVIKSPMKNTTSDNRSLARKRPCPGVTDFLPKAATICAFSRFNPGDLVEEPTSFDDDEDQPILNAAGKLRYPAIMRKP